VNLRHTDSGFAVVARVFGAAEIDELVRELDAHTIRRSRAGARHLLSTPAIAAVARDSRLINLATEVLGRAPVPFGATLFDKSPEANWLVAWHQDRALPLLERREAPGWGPWSEKEGVLYAHAPADVLASVVAIRLHLDDSTAQNGPLRVLPGTHRSGVLSDAQIHDAAQCIEPVVCTVDRGGVVIMRPLVVHASSKVTAQAPRRVLHFEYGACKVLQHGLRLHAA
jgi:ectoine hydroxylase-related dioxygenase (phytanoyl-CoA dioxygenase family)